MEFKTKLSLDELLNTANLVELLSEEEVKNLGDKIVHDFEVDIQSRGQWEQRMDQSLKLALQVAESKTWPWPGAANVKFPLVTIAALQYHARSYPVLLNGDSPVKCRVYGEDTKGVKTARAERIESHMNFQIMEEDEDWESEMDKILITQPIVGSAFKKTYFDPIKNHVVSENILAKDFVINYWAKSIDTAQRYTHVIPFFKNDIYERVARGLWADVADSSPTQQTETLLGATSDKIQGMSKPVIDETTPYEILEQYLWLDLDGDGYEEPYIACVRKDNGKVARLVARFFSDSIERSGDTILSITPEKYFTKYPFIPSPDGGFYDLGFGLLLGPINESINTIFNQLIDAGTMANTAGGFLGRGIKLRGGQQGFAPMEWKHVDTSGDDLRKNIMPLPVREPSQVLFTLLELLINYGERVGGAVDILTGQNPGQNTPAETTRTMAEQGMKVFNGIFKRTYRSFKEELRKVFRLNQLYITEDKKFNSLAGEEGVIMPEDYEGLASDVRPAADPNTASDSQRIMQAEMLRQSAMQNPMYNKYEVEKKFLKAMRVPDIERLLPDPKGPNAIPPPMTPEKAKIEIANINAKVKQADVELQQKLGLLKLMKEAELQQSKIKLMEAQVMEIMAGIQDAKSKQKLAELQHQIDMSRERREGIMNSVEVMTKAFGALTDRKEAETDARQAASGGVS
jgi:chaperonin GroES